MPASLTETVSDSGRIRRLFFLVPVVTGILLFAYIQWSTVGVFSIVALSIFLYLFIKKIKVGFLSLLILKPLIDVAWDVNLFSVGGISINVLKLTGVIIPLLCTAYLLTNRKPFLISRLNIGVLLFIAVNVVSVMVYLVSTFDPESMLFSVSLQILRILNGVVVYLAIPLVFDEEGDQMLLLRVLFYSTLFPSLLSALVYLTGRANVTIGQEIERFAGVYHDAGGMSITAFIGLTASLLFLYALDSERSRHLLTRILTLAMVPINLFLLYITYTRMMYIVTLVFLALWISIRYRKPVLVLVASPLVLLAIVQTEEFQQRNWKEIKVYEAYVNHEENADRYLEYSGGGRIMYWTNALDRIGEFDVAQLALGTGTPTPVHNEYLDIILRTGFVGLMIFLYMLVGLAVQLWKRYAGHPNELTGTMSLFGLLLLVSFALMGLTGYTLSQTTFGIYMWTAIAIALYGRPPAKTIQE